jgi:hypothetical protein
MTCEVVAVETVSRAAVSRVEAGDAAAALDRYRGGGR